MEIFRGLHINVYLRSHDLQSVSGSSVVGRGKKGKWAVNARIFSAICTVQCRITKSLKKLCKLVE